MSTKLDIHILRGRLVVSCQAYPGEALFGGDMMARLAAAAKDGGAAAIRANSPQDIAAIKKTLELPVIGLWKRHFDDSDVYITPRIADVLDVAAAGADIVALDATLRPRPDGERLPDIVRQAKERTDCLLMADVSTVEEGLHAAEIGFDLVSTTLSGYTPYSPQTEQPDFELIAALSGKLEIPVFAEGRVQTPEQALRCLELGAFAVVVGTAITRPQVTTRKFVDKLSLIDLKNV